LSHGPLIEASQTAADRAAVLPQIQEAFGTVPNMFRAVADSPAALRGMWGSFGALGGGTTPAKLGEQIAVAVGDRNHFENCLAARMPLGRDAGATAEEVTAAQAGHAADPKTDAALRFALQLVEQRGQVSGDDVHHPREVGFADKGIVEIVAHAALNLLTNDVNVALNVSVGFPQVKLRRAA
jgi:alkylhydroperoxidase family enzyme